MRDKIPPLGPIALIATGLSGALTTVCQMTAIGLAGVPHVIAVKRASIMLSVGWGALFFHERVGLRRLAGALLMTTGAVLILIIR